MYERPTIITAQQAASGDQIKVGGKDLLAKMHDAALREVAARANVEGEYLDPNSLIVTVRVEARVL